MSHSRRELMRGVAAFGAGMAVSWGDVFASVDAGGEPLRGYGPLRDDPHGVLDLPAGFSYRILSKVGDEMDDGFRVPGLADGMHAFKVGADTVLVRNHELNVGDRDHAFTMHGSLPAAQLAKLYDPKVGAGATTTVVMQADGRRVRQQFLSLAGTLRNCSGGATPWGSWLSCEESVLRRGEHGALRDHGYAFEVAAAARELIAARPLIAMGRFHREAVAIDPRSGIVYQSEDRPDGLFYRFVPHRPGQLAAGGRLQAMVVEGFAGRSTANRHLLFGSEVDGVRNARVSARTELPVSWLDLDKVESPDDDLRTRGKALGATTFVRGEGLAVQQHKSGVSIWFVCTAGGPSGLGQIWRHRPHLGPGLDNAKVKASTGTGSGTMELFLEPSRASMMRHGDNLTMAPNDDVLVCEDQADRQRLLGVTANGGVYTVARNSRGDSELAGACFAPAPIHAHGRARAQSGHVLYLNIQRRGLTLAVSGPWLSRDARLQA